MKLRLKPHITFRRRARRSASRLSDRASMRWILVMFFIAILICAGLLTSTAYMLLVKTDLAQTLMRSHLWPMIPVLFCILMAAILAGMFAGQKIRPIRKVNEAMKKVSRGDFSIHLDESEGFGEIRELIVSYNHMAEELRSIELFRKDFINNFSHEFKTPIVSIRGFARLLERDDLSDEQRREYARIIAAESERLANMSSNILLLTKLENQQIVTNKADYSLDEQIRSCILMLEKQWEDKKLELQLDLPEITYRGDEEMMSHVWVNLLSNAVKFSPVGGVLEVSCMRVQNFIEVRVTDHGEGMDEETQKRVFEKFFQGDTAHASEGNGLGLSLAKRIVDLCGGKITLFSAPGEGTTFSVYLPVEEDSNS